MARDVVADLDGFFDGRIAVNKSYQRLWVRFFNILPMTCPPETGPVSKLV